MNTPLDKKLADMAETILGNALLPGGEARMKLLTPMAVSCLKTAIREAIVESGAVGALEDAAALAQLVEPSDEEDLDTVSKLERAHALYDTALAKLRALTQP